MRFQPPPPATSGAAERGSAAVGSGPRLPGGPILYMGERTGTVTTLAPVAWIVGDSLIAFPEEDASPGFAARLAEERHMPGTEFVLFAGGTRVGRLLVDSTGVDSSFCRPRPTVSGVVELVPGAVGARRFLALAEAEADGFGHGPFSDPGLTSDHASASERLAEALVPLRRDLWPGSWSASRGDLQVVAMGGDGPRAVAASFVHRDSMGVGPAGESAWALFVLGVDDGGRDDEYQPLYAWFRDAAREGKGAPRFFEQLDWDLDGEPELLLEVLGATHRWPAAVARSGGQWRRVFQDPCGVPGGVDPRERE